MKNVFAMTGNVELFVALANSLINRDRGVDGGRRFDPVR